MNRIGLKIACLAAAIVIWIQVASTTVSEADLRMPIVVVNVPAGLTIAGAELPREANVRVRAAKLRVIAHKYLHRPLGRVELDLASRQADAPFLYEITPADVRTDQDVVAVLPPARLPLRLEHLDQRRVPVGVETAGRLPAGKVLLSSPVARPDAVAIGGPQRQLREVRTVATVPVPLGEMTASQTLRVALVAPGPDLRLEPDEVEVTVLVADLAVRVMADVPVTAAGVGGRDVAVSPALCDVTIEGPADSVRAMRLSDLRVLVDAAPEQRDVQQVRARLVHPAWVTRATVVPEVFVIVTGDGRRR